MSIKTLKDFNRLPINLHRSSIKEVLPEYFQSEYPNIILFLEYYYDYLDNNSNFGELIQDLYTCRDAEDNLLEQMDLMFREFGQGTGVKYFSNPREVIRNFAKFYRVKGSKYSAEGFFRAFFLTDAQIHYPKNDLFYLNDSVSEIGVDQQKVLQDGGVYQLLSHLVRTDVGIPAWGELYKKFVHPAGFHLAAEIVIQSPGKVFSTDAVAVGSLLEPTEFNLDVGIGTITQNFIYDSLGASNVPETTQKFDITSTTKMYFNGDSYNVRLHTRPLREDIYLNRSITTLSAAYPTLYSWGAQTREIWNTTTDSATLIRVDSNPSLHLGNGIDSYGYYGTYPSFYVGTGDNPDYLKTPYPSIITTSLAYAELGAAHFAKDSDMTQAFPLYDSDINPV